MSTLPVFTEWLTVLDAQLARIVRCLDRLDADPRTRDAIWRRPRAGVNSIGNLCLHLAGNESHYIGHLVGGSDDARDRRGEFEAEGGYSREDLVERLEAARQTTREVFARLDVDDLERVVASDHPPRPTVGRVALHVVEHYAYHAGQIVLLTRLAQSGDERLLEWGH